MVNGDSGTAKNTPAPWVPWAKAGCDVGNVSTANAVLENNNAIITNPLTTPPTPDPTGDMTKVFGVGSPEWNDGRDSQLAPFGTAARAKALTDYVGIAIHCGAGGGICDGDTNARPDVLPDEPGGYTGYQALFGAKYVNPAINGGAAAVNDTNGDPIEDPFHHPGFPGFDGVPAKVSLGYVAQMQEAGVPVTFAYISDAHDNHTSAFPARPTRPAPSRVPRARVSPTTSPRCTSTTPHSRRSSPGSPTTGSTSRTRCSWSPPTRTTTSPAATRPTAPGATRTAT